MNMVLFVSKSSINYFNYLPSNSQKFGNITNFKVFERSLFWSVSLHLFDKKKYNKKHNIVKYYYNLK